MAQESVSTLLLEQLHESPFNPRLTFDETGLDELAASISQQGVLQPIVVRPIVKGGLEHQFEVVFGHRRLRAATRAGYVSMPAIVRPMTDEEAAVAQIHENLKRQDVHPLEEALGYVRLMKDHGLSIAELITRAGRSKSYIYGRLKLAQLGEEARAACLRGELDAETAVLVARYCRSPKLQERALKLVVAQDHETGARRPLPYRLARQTLRDNFCIHISAAPFDTHDSKLAPGSVDCSSCSRLAGNDPELADSSDADICTDRACYQAKCEAHTERLLAAARAAGARTLRHDSALALWPEKWRQQPRGHVQLTDEAFVVPGEDGEVARSVTFADVLADMGKKAPQVVAMVSPHQPGKVLQLLPDDDAERLLTVGWAGGKVAPQWCDYFDSLNYLAADDDDEGADTITPTHVQRPVVELTPEERTVLDRAAWSRVSLAVLQRVRTSPRTVDDLRMLVRRELHLTGEFDREVEAVMGWTEIIDQAEDRTTARRDIVDSLNADDLAAVLLMMAIVNDAAPRGRLAAERVTLAQRYGVDVLATGAPPAEASDSAKSAATSADADADIDAEAQHGGAIAISAKVTDKRA